MHKGKNISKKILLRSSLIVILTLAIICQNSPVFAHRSLEPLPGSESTSHRLLPKGSSTQSLPTETMGEVRRSNRWGNILLASTINLNPVVVHPDKTTALLGETVASAQEELSANSTQPPANLPETTKAEAPPTTDEQSSPATTTSTSTTSEKQPASTTKASHAGPYLLTAAGVALVAGAAVALGGGGSSSDATSSSGANTISLASLVRIGDDSDYNGNHPDNFQQNTPSGTRWAQSFTINNINSYQRIDFLYTVAGSKMGNPIYINGQHAGNLCNPGNTAWNIKDCSADIKAYVTSGSNQITIVCAIDPDDNETPYDDVEMYNLRIELTK